MSIAAVGIRVPRWSTSSSPGVAGAQVAIERGFVPGAVVARGRGIGKQPKPVLDQFIAGARPKPAIGDSEVAVELRQVGSADLDSLNTQGIAHGPSQVAGWRHRRYGRRRTGY